MKKFISLALLLFLWGTTANAQSVYWELRSPEGKVSHLFGTYHLLGANYLDDHPEMLRDIQRAQTVVVETLVDSSQLMQVAMAGMDASISLKRMTDSASYHLLQEVMEPLLGIPLSAADQLFPLNLSMSFSLRLASQSLPTSMRYDGAPIDLYIGWKAGKQGQHVVGLESLEEQMNILFHTQSPEAQMRDLLSLLSDTAEARSTTVKLIQAYEKGDLNGMYARSTALEESMGDMAVWLDERNRNWMPTLLPLLQKGNCFVAVGALHLPGESGLLQLLEEEGYTLRPIAL